jgi:hypothetical protein
VLLRQAERPEQARVLEADDPRDPRRGDGEHQHSVRVKCPGCFALVDRERRLPVRHHRNQPEPSPLGEKVRRGEARPAARPVNQVSTGGISSATSSRRSSASALASAFSRAAANRSSSARRSGSAGHVPQDQHRALPRGQVLQRRDKGQPDTRPRHRHRGRIRALRSQPRQPHLRPAALARARHGPAAGRCSRQWSSCPADPPPQRPATPGAGKRLQPPRLRPHHDRRLRVLRRPAQPSSGRLAVASSHHRSR